MWQLETEKLPRYLTESEAQHLYDEGGVGIKIIPYRPKPSSHQLGRGLHTFKPFFAGVHFLRIMHRTATEYAKRGLMRWLLRPKMHAARLSLRIFARNLIAQDNVIVRVSCKDTSPESKTLNLPSTQRRIRYIRHTKRS